MGYLFKSILKYENGFLTKIIRFFDKNFERLQLVYKVYEYGGEYEIKYIKAHPEKFVFDGYYNKIV